MSDACVTIRRVSRWAAGSLEIHALIPWKFVLHPHKPCPAGEKLKRAFLADKFHIRRGIVAEASPLRVVSKTLHRAHVVPGQVAQAHPSRGE